MANRNFSMMDYFNRIAAAHKPELAFTGRTLADWRAWKKKAYPKFMELLGTFPKPSRLNAEVVAAVEENGVVKERVVFDSEDGMSVPCIVCRPKRMKKDGKGRAIVCSHGHGPHGKNAVAGIGSGSAVAANVKELNYNYGEQMAQHGFLTVCPDLRGFGERRDGEFPGRDPCNVHFIRGAILGIYTLTLNIFDLKRCVDYLRTRPEVDAGRVGLMGLSQGGTMATFAGAAEPRFKAVDIMCYLNSWRDFGVRKTNFCGSQIVPQIFRYFDTHDVAGLIAPRPLLVEMGMWDTCFPIDQTSRSVAPLRRIYRAAGIPEKLEFDLFAGPHAFAGNKAFAFFDKHL